MAFQLNALDPSNSGSGGAASLGTYRSGTDDKATILSPGYFDEAAGNLRWTKALLIAATDAVFIASITSDNVTVTATEMGGGVEPQDILDVLANPENLPVNIGDKFSVTEDGPAALVDIGVGPMGLPIYPWAGVPPEEGGGKIVAVSLVAGVPVMTPAADARTSSGNSAPKPGEINIPASEGRVSVGSVPANAGTNHNFFAINYVSLKQWLLPLTSANMSTDARQYVMSMARSGTTFSPSYILLSAYASAPSDGEIARFGTSGRMRIADGVSETDAASVGQLNGRLSVAQRTAIDALDADTATVADIVNALKAV